jgi:hypothetical protein
MNHPIRIVTVKRIHHGNLVQLRTLRRRKAECSEGSLLRALWQPTLLQYDTLSMAPMFQRATGMSYVQFFRRLHAAYVFDWYLEIGCRSGRILDMARGKSIGVDPVFRLARPLLGRKPQLHLFQESSDAFFGAGHLSALGGRVSVAFIDGMHLFEYALRDVLNTEHLADPNGVIFVHDVCPFSIEMTTRDLQDLPDIWTGDVWKLIPILRAYRPDLTLTVLDARPTGLLAITGLKPGKTQPEIDLLEVTARYETFDLNGFGFQSFADLFQFVSAKGALDADRFGLSTLSDPSFGLKEPGLITP